MLFSVTLFYGYPALNGTLEKLSMKVVYASKKMPWSIAIVLFIIAIVLSGIGAGDGVTVMLIPIAISIAKISGMKLSTHCRIIAHDIQDVNIKLAEGQYFYSDIKKECCILYDTGSYKLAGKRRLKPEEKNRIAQDYFDQWFERAKVFFKNFEYNLGEHLKGQTFLNLATFMLHQATETSYKTILFIRIIVGENEQDSFI